MKPRALDLFCGAGGATRGLQLAGFHVTGVDIKPQPRYVGDVFHQADALNPPVDLADFDFIWASPPCQAYSSATKPQRNAGQEYPDLVAATRAMLASHLHCIENVIGAPLRKTLELDGTMFGLGTIRRRQFEMNFICLAPHSTRAPGDVLSGRYITVCGHGPSSWFRQRGVGWSTRAEWRDAMGIDWMNVKELAQSIPPAYGEFIGRAALQYIKGLGGVAALPSANTEVVNDVHDDLNIGDATCTMTETMRPETIGPGLDL